MKNLTFIILILPSLLLNAQDDASKREDLLKKQNICHQVRYITDSLGDRYTSREIFYNSQGKDSLMLQYDKEGNVSESITMILANDSIEVNVYWTPDETDTSFYLFDKSGRQIYEYWYWGDDEEYDESYYTYEGDSDVLICKVTVYSWGVYTDSLFYEDGRLIRQNTYDDMEELDTEIEYVYENELLKSEHEYNALLGVTGSETRYEYDEKGQLIRRTDEYPFSGFAHVREYSYYEDGTLRKELIKHLNLSRPNGTTEILYTRDGLEEKIIQTLPTGKNTITEYSFSACDK